MVSAVPNVLTTNTPKVVSDLFCPEPTSAIAADVAQLGRLIRRVATVARGASPKTSLHQVARINALENEIDQRLAAALPIQYARAPFYLG